MTKRQRGILNRYINSHLYELRQCYNSWSDAKEYALWKCKYHCEQANGYNFKIISYNSQMFSIGYCYKIDEVPYFHYETNRTSEDWRID